MAIIRLHENVTVIQVEPGDPVAVTRPCIMGGVAVHIIASEYSAVQIAEWLQSRLMRLNNPLAQQAFPNMKAEDREFLMSGITPEHWNKMFPKEEQE